MGEDKQPREPLLGDQTSQAELRAVGEAPCAA